MISFAHTRRGGGGRNSQKIIPECSFQMQHGHFQETGILGRGGVGEARVLLFLKMLRSL